MRGKEKFEIFLTKNFKNLKLNLILAAIRYFYITPVHLPCLFPFPFSYHSCKLHVPISTHPFYSEANLMNFFIHTVAKNKVKNEIV